MFHLISRSLKWPSAAYNAERSVGSFDFTPGTLANGGPPQKRASLHVVAVDNALASFDRRDRRVDQRHHVFAAALRRRATR